MCKILSALTCIACAQGGGESNTWYFGHNAGLDFNLGTPVAIAGGMVSTYEGSAAVSDATGHLLFYTDGLTLWDRNHQPMPNGTGLLGDLSSTQSSLIVQKPGSSTIYYVFTLDNQAEVNGLRYTEVDMTLNSGFGDATSNKNILLHAPTTEKITAVRHCNNKDIWVVSHDFDSNAFRCFPVTSQGISANPVISNAGVIHNASILNVNAVGYMKVSPQGNRLALGIYGSDIYEVFDFDNSTGTVSNAITFTNYTDAYGLEFSPDGTKLYLAPVFLSQLWQVDLCAGDSLSVVSSAVQVGVPSYPAGMQLGPDGKIYVSLYNSPWLGVINNPNAPGASCGYVNNGISVGSGTCQLGLPNFPAWNFNAPVKPVMVPSVNCLEGTFTLSSPSTASSTGCSSSSPTGIISVSWNFGDSASADGNASTGNSVTHVFSSSGTYDVQMIVQYACYTDTITSRVVINDCALRAEARDTQLCPGTCTELAVDVSGGKAPYTYSWSHGLGTGEGPFSVCPNETTSYIVTVTDCTGASFTDTALFVVNEKPNAAFTVKEASSSSCNLVSFADQSSGASSWSWCFGDGYNTTSSDQHPQCNYTQLGTYNVTLVVSNSYGCTDTAIHEVDVQPQYSFYMPNAFTPDGDGLNDQFFPSGTGINYSDFKLLIYNRWGELIYQTDDTPWDGKVAGASETAPQDVYVWKVITRDEMRGRHEYTGHVNLLK